MAGDAPPPAPEMSNFTDLLSKKYRSVPAINLDGFAFEPLVLALIPAHLAQQYRAIPLLVREDLLIVAFENPKDAAALTALAKNAPGVRRHECLSGHPRSQMDFARVRRGVDSPAAVK
jgi:hypothetical protein